MVMQIQVQDAFKAEADQVMEQIKEQVAFESIERNDPESIDTAETIQINIRGVKPDQVAASARGGMTHLRDPRSTPSGLAGIRRTADARSGGCRYVLMDERRASVAVDCQQAVGVRVA